MLICGVLLLLGQPGKLHAEEVLLLEAEAAFNGNYTPGSWLPIQVNLSNQGVAREVVVVATAGGTGVHHSQAVALPGGVEVQLTLYVALDHETRRLQVRVEAQEDVLASQVLELRPRIDERMLGLLGAQDPQLRLPRRQDLSQQPFNSFLLTPAEFPVHMAGLSSLGLLLVHDLPAEALRSDQQQALLGWVHAGGHLLIGGGSAAERTATNLPAALLPATFGATIRLNPDPLAALAEVDAGPRALTAVQLRPLPGVQINGPETAPAWVSHAIGRGRVTQLAFDPAQTALLEWADAPAFWYQLLRPALLVRGPNGMQTSVDPLQEQILTSSLTSMPAIPLPPTERIFALLALYTILIGPGVALLLRRIDRQAWAWVVVPVVALLVGAGVFGLAVLIRPDERLVNQISLIEVLEPGQARVRSLVGVLVPQDQRLTLTLSDDALLRPVRPTSGSFGMIEGVTGELPQFSPRATLDAKAWRIQGLIADQQLAFDAVHAEMVVVDGAIQLTLENRGEQALRDVAAVFGEYIIRLGLVEPGEQRVARWPTQAFGGPAADQTLSTLVLRDELALGRRPGQAPPRELLVREALINAAVVRNATLTDEGPLIFAWLERSPLAIDVAGPAAVQTTNLLVMRPHIHGSGPLTLPRGWLKPDWSALEWARCMGGQGWGIPAQPAPVIAPLHVPPGLALLRAEALTLVLTSERRWPNAGVTTELYDWAQARWVEQDFEGPGELRVNSPETYLRNGQLLVRLDGRIGEATCLYLSAQLEGTLP
ncbi:hypothetical protein CJ255_06510 [Candidatus Viridilinea mediisalina]|uniref:DUF4350 domain-containing protein n=2 Tax=Candidatus Viridilinea mediisalina TaxID=2024553 RepID=A0A2A6RM10_9CHLR|nr:hypothetical protein CJ255_06510 [Candidatus Viridilinea mediisalina]